MVIVGVQADGDESLGCLQNQGQADDEREAGRCVFVLNRGIGLDVWMQHDRRGWVCTHMVELVSSAIHDMHRRAHCYSPTAVVWDARRISLLSL